MFSLRSTHQLATRRPLARRAAAVRAPAAPAPRIAPPRPRTAAVRVLAFRDDDHRREMIGKMGDGLINAWFKGMQEGVEAVRGPLFMALDPRVQYTSHMTPMHEEGRGPEFIAHHLAAERRRVEVHGWKILASAVCPEDDTYFALVEVTYCPRGEKAESVAYKVFEADVLCDDTALRALTLHERPRLSPLPALLSPIAPGPRTLDVAAGPKALFRHWRGRVAPRGRVGRGEVEVEGVEVVRIAPDGKVQDVWTFRDPLDYETLTIAPAM